MNVDFNFYDACYKISALSQIKGEKVFDITDHLSVESLKRYKTDGDPMGASEEDIGFALIIYRDDNILQKIDFDYISRRSLNALSVLTDDDYDKEARMRAMEILKPSAAANFLREKPLLSREEQEIIIDFADQLTSKLENSKSKH